MKNIVFKGLQPNQIEVRPTGTNVKGQCTLLLYIDSRCAANILNDVVGEFNWSIEYKDVGGKGGIWQFGSNARYQIKVFLVSVLACHTTKNRV